MRKKFKKMKQSSLKKIIFISFLLSISFIIEFVLTKVIFGHSCQNSLIKLELLPLILIGFFFGFKYSFYANLLYICIHIILESNNSIHQHSLLKEGYNNNETLLIIGVLLFLFIIPYLACSLIGIFCSKNSNNFFKTKNIWISLSLTTIIQSISYILFVCLFYKNKNVSHHIFDHMISYKDSIQNSLNINPGLLIFLYFFFSVTITNIITGICLHFIKRIFQDNIVSFL
ncbi:hypothetical protein [Columbia Basin potato purple top phytoplasma]|uniref:Integral membrane protein n=1 Tax=Columbia Basin potato purple top phytoplasma TaxID=307134 RepID=A0ABT5LAT2_9MOLU|nr:hypothetical protein [Columbia Basin potato purple top phytoplasma]MDC9031892.1 hypothetical protein [Columbia Basin potato purple top phytoplasma]